jgi:spore coat protein U-like protein
MKSMFKLKNMQRVLLAAGLIAATTGALAVSPATTTFQVTANVNAQCTVSAVNLTFPAVDPLNSQTDGATTVTVNCTKNSAYTVGLSAGTTSGATIGQRKMANGPDTMDYNLYTNAGRTTVWGNSVGSWVSGNGAGMGTASVLDVYGRVAAGQTNLAVGTFTESTITVTVSY